jgi:hypothetical protein
LLFLTILDIILYISLVDIITMYYYNIKLILNFLNKYNSLVSINNNLKDNISKLELQCPDLKVEDDIIFLKFITYIIMTYVLKR